MKKLSSNRVFGGQQMRFRHTSKVLNCDMDFSVFLPPQIDHETVPVLYWLSGLTCNDQNFMIKAGAQRMAAELGIAIVCPDTSPRGNAVPDDPDGASDLGLGAGFYVNATQEPWSTHYQMHDYVAHELPRLVHKAFPVDAQRASIFGHSMGGHGALTIALTYPERYKSVSAFAPIVSPLNCPWGEKALSHYLGDDCRAWEAYDACTLIMKSHSDQTQLPMLVDQGDADNFLVEQLKPELLEEAGVIANYPIQIRYQEGYDHSYFFIASFIDEHLAFHNQHFS